jgi:hypothetical protein
LLLLVTACAGAPAPVAAPSASPPAAPRDARAVRIEQLLRAGRAAAREERWPDAEASLRQAVDAAYGFGSPWAGYRSEALSELARCQLAQGRAAEARATAAKGVGLLRAGAVDADQRMVELQTTQAEAFLLEKQPAMAVAPFETAALAAARHEALGSAQLAVALRLAETLETLGRRQDATKALERTLPAARRPEVGSNLARRLARALAALYDASGEHVKARALLAELAPDEVPAAATETAAAPAAIEAEAASNASNASEVAAMQADFRACYRAAVQNHADVAGRVALVLSIAADGHVSEVKAKTTNLPGSAVDCLKRRAALARFEPPKGGAAIITVPVTFVKQEND